MKKILFAALAALAITSCSQNEEIDAPAQKAEIKFNSIVNKSTRAANATTSTLESSTTGFHIYAYNVGESGTPSITTPFITNGVIKHDASGWSSDKKYYWPTNSDKVIFYAYFSPLNKVSDLTETDGKTSPEIKDYEIPVQTGGDTPVLQEDLLVAKTVALDNTTASVEFTFDHALTQVNFSIKPEVEDANLTYTVTAITITGVHNKGTYNYSTDKWTTSETLPADITYTYPINTSNAAVIANATNVATATPLDKSDDLLILMPQTLTDKATINIKYKVTKTENSKEETIFDATSAGKDIVIGNGSTTIWGEKHKIRYTLTLTNDAKDIKYSVKDINGWNAEENIDKTATGN